MKHLGPRCYLCKKFGHIANDCPDKDKYPSKGSGKGGFQKGKGKGKVVAEMDEEVGGSRLPGERVSNGAELVVAILGQPASSIT